MENILNNLAIKNVSHLSPTIFSQSELHQAQLSEVAVAVSINGISQAVMMLSPQNLKDFALGFCLSEGLLLLSSEVLDIKVHSHECGQNVDLHVLARAHHRLKERRRTIAGPSDCGLIREYISQVIPAFEGYRSKSSVLK